MTLPSLSSLSSLSLSFLIVQLDLIINLKFQADVLFLLSRKLLHRSYWSHG